MVMPTRPVSIDSRGMPVYSPLTARERQDRRDQAERWRVTTLNWALEHATWLPRHGLPNCLQGLKRVEFQHYDLTSGHTSVRIGGPMSTNFERLQELLQATGYVKGYHFERGQSAEKLAQNWSEQDHDQFCEYVTMGKAPAAKPEAPVEVAETVAAGTHDDGIGLDEVLASISDGAGAW